MRAWRLLRLGRQPGTEPAAARLVLQLHHCLCDPAVIREAMLADGISEDCLGWYPPGRRQPQPVTEADRLRRDLRDVLAADDIVSMSELRLRVLQAIERKAPEDWRGFLDFAERAGVPRSKRYDAADRWGRRRLQ